MADDVSLPWILEPPGNGQLADFSSPFRPADYLFLIFPRPLDEYTKFVSRCNCCHLYNSYFERRTLVMGVAVESLSVSLPETRIFSGLVIAVRLLQIWLFSD